MLGDLATERQDPTSRQLCNEADEEAVVRYSAAVTISSSWFFTSMILQRKSPVATDVALIPDISANTTS